MRNEPSKIEICIQKTIKKHKFGANFLRREKGAGDDSTRSDGSQAEEREQEHQKKRHLLSAPRKRPSPEPGPKLDGGAAGKPISLTSLPQCPHAATTPGEGRGEHRRALPRNPSSSYDLHPDPRYEREREREIDLATTTNKLKAT